MLRISKHDDRLYGTINLPLSKSISNRLLILRFLHPEKITITKTSQAEDTVLLESLLHVIRQYRDRPEKKILTLDIANSGTVMRFLIALLSVIPGNYILKGDKRMSHRPVGSLVDALNQMGADILYLETPGFLPLYIKGRSLLLREIHINASESSQHISALLLISTLFNEGFRIILKERVVSRTYIEMTLRIMEKCGMQTIWQQDLIRVFPGKIKKVKVSVEPDWSSAAFWYEALALAGQGKIVLPGLKRSGLQGDEIAAEFFGMLGITTEETGEGTLISSGECKPGIIEWDFRDCPDLAVPAIISCAFLHKEGIFRGLEGLRIKESDRIGSLQQELRNFNGGLIPESGGIWRLLPVSSKKKRIRISSHADHRIAMALMMAAMKGFELEIDDPDVVSKSYPGFWKDLQQAGFRIS